MKNHFAFASIIAGLAIGLFSIAPIIKFGNCFFCMWKILGGILASYLYFYKAKKIDIGEGFLLGLASGGIGFVIIVLYVILTYFYSPSSMMPHFIMSYQNLSFINRYAYMMERFPSYLFAFKIFSELFTTLLFSSLGGLIGGAIFSSSKDKQNPYFNDYPKQKGQGQDIPDLSNTKDNPENRLTK